MRTRLLVGLGSVLWALAGCDSGGSIGVRLQPLQSCGEVERAIREAAIQDMTEALAANLEQATKYQYCGRYGEEDANYGAAPPTASNSASPSPGGSGGGASQVSTTNNQVAGVDEADFIKNDNQYIYMVSAGAFRIIEAWPAPSAHTIGKLPIEGTPKKLFVQGSYALVYSSLLLDTSLTGTKGTGSGYYPGSSSHECTYGYNCQFGGDGNPTKISIIDISDRTAPKLVRELRTSASYLNARRIGSAVHTVFSAPGPSFKGLATWPSGSSFRCGSDTLELRRAFEDLRAANLKIIMETPVADLLPSFTDTSVSGESRYTGPNLLGSCQGFYKPDRTDGTAFTSLLSLDLDRSAQPVLSTIVSRPGAVYASAQALYMAVPKQRGNDYWYSEVAGDDASVVHRFDLAAGPARSFYAGSGVVKGRVLNQFSMDEHRGDLRIATSNGQVPSPDVHSTVTVLKLQGGALKSIGVIDNIAPKEDIRSVRFDGDRGYVVTFKKTDPLYVFDLSNPWSPRELAELKIDGFSTYMQMMDDHHLLTIGYDAADQGSFAWFTGVRLQIFDVSNPSAPRLAALELIGTRGSSSEALTNHLAFNYFAPKQLLALPMTVCEGGNTSGGYGSNMTFSGLMVYRVTPESGFSLTGKVAHDRDGASCSNWWTDATSTVKRSIIMDEFVFSVSEKRIKVNSLGNLAVDVMVIPVDG
jgi:hypothetical protein